MRQLFYYKMRQVFIAKWDSFATKNVTVTTNGNNFITNAMFITNCDSTISTGSL